MAVVNDNWASATVIAGDLGKIVGDTTTATAQGTEPAPRFGTNKAPSVWFKWTAPSAEEMVFWLRPEMDGIIDIYKGSTLASLVLAPGQMLTYPTTGAEGSSTFESVANAFTPVAGTMYSIRVTAVSGAGWVDRGAFTLRWQSVAAGVSAWKTPAPSEQQLSAPTYWDFSHNGPSVSSPGMLPTEAGYLAAWDALVADIPVAPALATASQHFLPGSLRQTDVGYAVPNGSPDGYWNINLETYVVAYAKPDTASFRADPELNMSDFPRDGGSVQWFAGEDTVLLPGGRIAVEPTSESAPVDPAIETQIEVKKRYSTAEMIPSDTGSAYPWTGTYAELVEGDSLGFISASGETITASFGQVSLDLSTAFATASDSSEYINLVYRNTADTTAPSYYEGAQPQWSAEIFANAKPYLRVQLPRYRTFTWITESVTWWDGDVRQPCQFIGWWDGFNLQPVALKGFSDGTTIKPIIGGD